MRNKSKLRDVNCIFLEITRSKTKSYKVRYKFAIVRNASFNLNFGKMSELRDIISQSYKKSEFVFIYLFYYYYYNFFSAGNGLPCFS